MAIVAALSAACTSTPDAAPAGDTAAASSTTSATSTTSTAAASAISPRGLEVKAVGQSASVTNAEGVVLGRFTLGAVTVDGPCAGRFSRPAQHGHMILLSIHLDMSPMATANSWSIRPEDFALVGPSGVTATSLRTAASDACLPDDERLPMGPYEPIRKYVGRLALDAPHASGTITYQPSGMAGPVNMKGGVGWEWAVPQS
ncbi:hypothetical protein AB0H12_44125 [Actinosynnema sp. NPDC023794]